MKIFGRLLLFAAVTCAGGFLLAELSDPAPAEGSAAATVSSPDVATESDAPTAETAQVAPAESEPVPVVKAHVAASDYKGGKDGKDFKDYAEPIAEGPGGAEDAPALLGPPIFFISPRSPAALAPVPLPPLIPIT